MSNLFLSVITTFLWGNVITLLFWYGRRKRIVQRYFGAASVIVLYLVCMMRMILPFDFGWQRQVQISGVFSDIYRWVVLETCSVGSISFTAVDVIAVIWIVVAVIRLSRYVYVYHSMTKRLSSLKEVEDCVCEETVERIFSEMGKRFHIEILKDSSLKGPLGIGLLKKRIVVPDRRFSEVEWYNILKHECTHFLKGDLWIKCFTQVCCCVMWWNPLSYLLRKELAQAMEIRCDLSATANMSNDERADYLQTIVNCLKGQDKKLYSYTSSSLIGGDYEKELEERFQMVAANYPAWNKKGKSFVTVTVMVGIIMFFSYSWVIFPKFEAPERDYFENEEDSILLPVNSYIEKRSDGSYYFVTDNTSIAISENAAKKMIKDGFKEYEED